MFSKDFPFGSLKVRIVQERVNSLPSHKILDFSKLTVFTNDNKLIIGRVENMVGKGENAG